MIRQPRKAIILAAGFGSRLAPLTREVPKPLIPLRGTPMIAHLLRRLEGWGVRDVLINLHHGADTLLREIPPLVPGGMRVQFSYEPEILGTGGSLRRMAWFFDDAPLWLANADVVMDLDPEPLLRAMSDGNSLAALWMVPDAGPKTVRVEAGRVVDFRSGGMTFSGLHLLSREVLRFVPEVEAFSSVVTAYEKAMAAGDRIAGVTVPGSRWADVGTPAQWLAAEGGDVIMAGARVDKGAHLQGAIVGPGARVRRGRTVSGLVVSPSTGLNEEQLGWLPEAEAVEVLDARGSDRSFLRVHGPKTSWILMRRGDARPENARFTQNTRFLAKQGVRVPEILRESRDGRTWLLEDAGRTHLLDAPSAANTRKALTVTAALHGVKGWRRLKLEPGFDAALYAWEHDLFFKEFLARHDLEADRKSLKKVLSNAAARLAEEPGVLIHRDLQSTNFLMHGGEAVLIDYQGMREGPAAYDLASFLADPYLARPVAEQLAGLAAYNRMAARAVSEEAYRAAVSQRLAQALGAYGRLGALPGTRRFLGFIAPAVRQWAAVAEDEAVQTWSEGFFERQKGKNTVETPL
jgi:mannose-1-phosphate guanylyltransferase